MSVFRSYFSKNDTLIENNETNNSQNPVTEISYGTPNAFVSRFILDIELQPLLDRIQQGLINPDTIQSHVLKMTNTIRYRPDLLDGRFAGGETHRASSFDLQLFNVTEDWDEGSGYDFVYDDEAYAAVPKGQANWYERKTDILWTEEGAFISGSSEVLATQRFEKGNEDIYIDVTDYINGRLAELTGGTGTTYGLGLKFTEDLEELETTYRQAVGFHAKKTSTFYEPHILTTFDSEIQDDRNYFFLDKDNELYLYANVGGNPQSLTVNSVTIKDYLGKEVAVISADSIQNVSLGVYKVTVNVDSDSYPDAVIFTDTWNVTQRGKNKDIEQEFYLVSQDNYFNFTLANNINFDNYFFNVIGISSLEKLKVGGLRKIIVDVKQLYPNQDNFLPLDIDYRVYNTQSDKYEIDVIPWTKVDRTLRGYEFVLDTSWFIPQDYFLELRLNSGSLFQKKQPIRFTVVSDGATVATDVPNVVYPTTTTTTTLPPTTTTTTTTLPPTTTTTTTTIPPTTTTTTTLPPVQNPNVFISVTPTAQPLVNTNTNNKTVNGDSYQLHWTTDSANTQKYGTSTGATLLSNTSIQMYWQPNPSMSFDSITTCCVGGMPICSGLNTAYVVNLNAGDNEGYVEFTINNASVNDNGYAVGACENVWWQDLGSDAQSSDPEYVLCSTAGTTYGYIDIKTTPNNRITVQGIVQP